jgi:hypothetical protein
MLLLLLLLLLVTTWTRGKPRLIESRAGLSSGSRGSPAKASFPPFTVSCVPKAFGRSIADSVLTLSKQRPLLASVSQSTKK